MPVGSTVIDGFDPKKVTSFAAMHYARDPTM